MRHRTVEESQQQMTTIEHSGIDQDQRAVLFGDGTIGSFFAAVADWATSTDHKKIGRLYAGMGMLALIGVAVIGALLGLERTDDAGNILPADSLLQLFQLHRVGLVFLVAIPLTLGLAVAVVPLQVGSRALAFARLALTGFYAWFAGAVLMIVALASNGGIGGGNAQMVDLFLAAHGLMILGIAATAGCIATTVLTTRAPGMTMRRVPFLTWSALIQALALLVALPVMLGVVVYLFIDHRNAQLVFGGAEGIGSWIGLFFDQPVTYIYAIPALGLLAEAAPVAFGKRHPMRQIVFAGIALVGIAALSAVTLQVDFATSFDGDGATVVKHLVVLAFFLGVPLLGGVIALATALMVAKPDAGAKPSIRPISPLLFGLLATLMLLLGMITGLLEDLSDLDLAGTVFAEGSAVLVIYAGALAALGGLVMWAPKLWGMQIPEKKVLPLALLGALATVLAAVPHVIAGFSGQAGGVGTYDGDGASAALNGIVLVGHALMALTVLGVAGAIATSRGSGDGSTNPWCAHTVEWSTTSPAPADNFAAMPTVRSAEPELDQTPEGSPS
jgi:heme/copper-type cytochrome/quinol oxidase subunit 1